MKKILICDDSYSTRFLLELSLEALQEFDVEILLAEDGEEGLRVARSEKPDLLFLDIMMPKLDGYQVSKAIKDTVGLEHTHIIMLSAKGETLDIMKGMQAGADNFINKPLDPDYILRHAATILGIELKERVMGDETA